MRASVIILLGGCLCLVLANTRDSPEEDITTTPTRRTFQRRKHVDLKATNGTRRRRKKPRRPQQQVLLTSVEGDNSTADVSNEAEYNQRVRSFASAIKDTDTFLRFLRLEESRHMRDYVRGRDFNFNNRSLTTRFLQNPMLRINERPRRPLEGLSLSQEERRSLENHKIPTGRQFDPTQKFNNDVGSKFDKEVARPHYTSSRERKRSRTARRRFESVPKFSNEVNQSAGDRTRPTTRHFAYTTQPEQDSGSGSHNEDNISETSTDRMEIVPDSRIDVEPSKDDAIKTTIKTLPSTLEPKQDFEQSFSEATTEKAEVVSAVSNEEQLYTKQGRRPTTKTLTTIPQPKEDIVDNSELKPSKIIPDITEVSSPNLKNDEQQPTAESRTPTSRTIVSTSQPVLDLEPRPRNENRRSRTRPAGSRLKDQNSSVETRRKTTKHFESTAQPKRDNEVTRSLPNSSPRDNPRSRSSSERFDNFNTNYETRTTTDRQFIATPKSHQDPESRFENELTRTRTSDTFEVIRNTNRNEDPPIFVPRTTTRRYEATTLPIQFTESRSAKAIKHSRTSQESFEKHRKKDREQTSHESRTTTLRQLELTTQSNSYSESENEVTHVRTSTERFENVPVMNHDEQQSAFETRRPTARQYETATQSKHDRESRLEDERKTSQIIPDRFEHVSNSNHQDRILPEESQRTTSRHFVPTPYPEQDVGSRFFNEDLGGSRDTETSKISLERFEIVPISPEEQQLTLEVRRKTAGLFNSKPRQDFDSRYYSGSGFSEEVTHPSIRFVPPDYSEKLYPTRRSDDEAKYDSDYRTSTPKPYRYLNDDYDEIKVPNRGLQPPIEPIPNDYDYVTTPRARSAHKHNNNNSTVTRKKGSRKSKSRNPDRFNKQPDDDYDELRLTAAESTYYKKRKLTHLPMIDTYDSQQVIPGVAGRDYTVFSAPPDSEFACGKGHMGYFADVAAGCQVFYICTGDGRGEPMLCPNGTLFNQNVLVCDWWFNVVCNYK